ncbi:MAG: 50S ribosomal protein L29 [Porphyromonadaceae bacterium]|nr:50S ribosomal protein L29 [Porphyromonadaceae bacterium]
MKTAEIKELSTKELRERIEADAVALNRMKINHSITPLDNPMQIKALRRSIARMKCEVRQRELNNK